MLFIQYNVSGEIMELLKTFISLFLGEEKSKDVLPLLNLFIENNFNLNKTLSNIDLSSFLPSIMSLLSGLFQNKTNNQSNSFSAIVEPLKISDFLSDDIVSRLNSAFVFN